MTVKEAVKHLENMKWLKGYDNTTVGGVPIADIIDDIIALLKAQGVATVEPKRIELADETKAWLDKMDAVDALNNIADICIDWDGYRTADGLGGLINEIWAYARYCADRLLKAQEPKRGRWIPHPESELWDVCSVCGIGCKRRERDNGAETEYSYWFCPNCGARLEDDADGQEG